MKRNAWWLCAVGFLAAMRSGGEVRRAGGKWELENARLKVTLSAESAHLTIEHKETGTIWQQESPEKLAKAQRPDRVRRAARPVRIDGSDQDWLREGTIWLPWIGDDGERNLSGGARLMWDERMLYLYVRVRDNQVDFGREAAQQWWEADSVEFWVDRVQVGLHLYPGREAAVDAAGKPFTGTRLAVARISSGSLPGYAVEVAMPLVHFPVLRNPAAGVRFSFAIGLNDADPAPGVETKRIAQGYHPRTWVHSVPETFAVAVLTDAQGKAPPLSRENDRTAGTLGGRVERMGPGDKPDSLVVSLTISRGQTRPLPLLLEYVLLEDRAGLEIRLVCREGAGTPMRRFNYPPALYPSAPSGYFLAAPAYGNGCYVPVGDKLYRNRRLAAFGGDMPWAAVTDGRQGMLALAMTPFDAAIQMQSRADDPERLGFPGFSWEPTRGAFGEPRVGRLIFFAAGGHVKACKIYRQVAREQGHLRTLREKAGANPDTRKLLGAVNWWGAHGIDFVREAKAAGMNRGLVNGRWSAEDMAEIVRLGWLVGEYDNYVDIDDSPTIARAKAPVKEHAVVKADGELMTAWVTRDEDMKPVHTYMKQCTAKQLECARALVPKVLETYPYNARFLDVTTAESPRECYSDSHPADRTADVANRQQLGRYIAEELGLVTGGEHGRFWDVGYLHYHEGMMGGGMYSWPAGYLRDVKDRAELSERYLTYSINPANRAPLFELVFHDCVVDYWYWGACSDYLHQVAPELTDRKTAMNILYGTPPMMWVRSHGLRWQIPAERKKMLEIYRNTCKLHEIIGMQEMVSHTFLSEDRLVQQTEFEDGTVCTVNFGESPYRVRRRTARREVLELGVNDFYVHGPRIEQWQVRTDSRGGKAESETRISTADYLFVSSGKLETRADGVRSRGEISVQTTEDDRARIHLGPGAFLELDLGAWRPGWRDRSWRVLQSDGSGDLTGELSRGRGGMLALEGGRDSETSCRLLVGEAARVPDLTIRDLTIRVDGERIREDVPLPGEAVMRITASVANRGLAAAGEVELVFSLDGPGGPILRRESVSRLEAGGERRVGTRFAAARADGRRRIVARLVSREPVSLTGRTRSSAAFTGPVSGEAFSLRRQYELSLPVGDCGGMAVELPFRLETDDGGLADPGNLRVLFPDGVPAPAQFEPSARSAAEGVLVFCLPSGLPPAGKTSVWVLGVRPGDTRVMPHSSRFQVAADGSVIRMGTFSAVLAGGVLSDLSVIASEGRATRVLERITISAKETGWTRENGTVEEFTCEVRGPVRSVFSCTKLVENRFRLRRKWLFYADRVEIHSSCTPPLPTLTRAFYARPGTATNATGRRARMDGSGNGEDFGFQGQPAWYAVFSEAYRNACIALTPPSGFVYWDGGLLGQISLDHAGPGMEKRVYIWGPGSPDDAFARNAARAYAEGVRARAME